RAMTPGKVILAGGTGFIGQSLARALASAGYQVVILTRSAGQCGREEAGVRYVQWDARTLGPWAAELDGARAVVNLAGKNVNCRYTPEARQEIIKSRLDSVRVIAEAIGRCAHPPVV